MRKSKGAYRVLVGKCEEQWPLETHRCGREENKIEGVIWFLLGESPASDLYMPTFRNTLSVPSSKAGVK